MKLTICDLTKRYHSKTAVNHLNLEIGEGIVGLLGPNGAGKTTLIRMLCDILKPTEGKICLDGEDIHLLGERYREILGYLPQKVGYYPWFTAEEYLTYLACLKGMERRAARERTDVALSQVGLEEMKKKKIRTFSGGMVQRLGIAQALLNEPEILVLDEPTAGLDPKERIRFRNLIAQLAKGHLVLLSTHIVSDIEHVATDIILLKGGNVAVQDTNTHITDRLRGQVFKILAEPEDAARYQQKYLVTNILPVGDKMELRMVCRDDVPAEAQPTEPELEDVYLDICRG